VEAQLPFCTTDEIRQMRFWTEENFRRPDDAAVYFLNPGMMADEIVTFYENSAWQILNTWMTDDGLQYLGLTKSPTGRLGATRLVEYRDDDPPIRVQPLPDAAQE